MTILHHLLCTIFLLSLFSVNTLKAGLVIEPLFRLTQIQGSCEVRIPDAASYEKAGEGRTFPYGTRVRTGRDSSVEVVLGSDDQTTFGANSEFVVDYDGDPTDGNKVFRIERGSLSYNFTRLLGESNRIRALTPLAYVEKINGRGKIEVSPGELISINITPARETVVVHTPHFSINPLAGGNQALITASLDRTHMALRNLRGNFQVSLHDHSTEDDPVTYEMTPQTSLKLWRRVVPIGGNVVVSGVLADPSGYLKDEFSFVETADALTDNKWSSDYQVLTKAPEQEDRDERKGFMRRTLFFWKR